MESRKGKITENLKIKSKRRKTWEELNNRIKNERQRYQLLKTIESSLNLNLIETEKLRKVFLQNG